MPSEIGQACYSQGMSEEKYPTAVSQLDAMKGGERSSTDLVNASLKRIGECNPTLNAVITLAEERALAEAEAWIEFIWTSGLYRRLRACPF